MKGIMYLVGFILAFTAVSCTNDRHQDPQGTETGQVGDDLMVRAAEMADNAPAGEFTLQQVEQEVFGGVGKALQWDGQPINDFVQDVFLTVGDQCGEGNCGKKVYLNNSNDSIAIRVVITIPFTVENSAGYIGREYILQPGEKLEAGCSHLCQNGEGVEFRRAIVTAEKAEQ